ncbi:hypothetical protein [Tenacibaculum maritimum]|uniref:hypothetical protein n=1 Tax=Tenacibaculum maritimum TaxID=107401 RepID=UPI0012E6481E|nr:hypothetical protein [Tenacibaculum maritimum]CAA0211389.1 conserved hypothetical protein [Tenacibaculum maritimum]
MEFGLKDILYIVGIVISALGTFLGTRHKLKEYIRDKNDEIRTKLHDLDLKLAEQKSKDDLQQQVIDQIGSQMDTLVPKLIETLNERKKSKK